MALGTMCAHEIEIAWFGGAVTAPPSVPAARVQSVRTDGQCEVWRGGLNWKHCVATARDLEMTVRLFFSWWGHPYVAWAAL
jgi:hypothetical protein